MEMNWNNIQGILQSPKFQGISAGLLSSDSPNFMQALGQGLQLGNQYQQQANQQKLMQDKFLADQQYRNARLKMAEQQAGGANTNAAQRMQLAKQQFALQQQQAQEVMQRRQLAQGILNNPDLSPQEKQQQIGGLLTMKGDLKSALGTIPGLPQSPAKMSAEKIKLSALSSSASKNLDELGDMYKSGKVSSFDQALSQTGSGTMGALMRGVSPEAQKLNLLISNLTDAVGRLRSGGAINQDEEARFRGLLPQSGDSKSTIEEKIKQMKEMFGDINKGLGKSSANTATDVEFNSLINQGLNMKVPSGKGKKSDDKVIDWSDI